MACSLVDTDVSEELTDITRVMTLQKTAIFIRVAMRTSKLMALKCVQRLLRKDAHKCQGLVGTVMNFIIIIIGSAAQVFLRSFCQLKFSAIASSDFVTRVFSRVGLSTPRPTPGYPRGLMYSVSLNRLVPILKRQDLAFCPMHDLAV
jgi:hypothetical protein